MEYDNLLMTPGPVPMPESVLNELSKPMIHHRTPQFTQILKEVNQLLKPVFKTQQDVICLSSTGTGAMEAAMVNILSPKDKILVIESGKFGERWTKIAKVYGVQVHNIDVPWGQAVDLELFEQKLTDNKYKAIFTQSCETSTATLQPVMEMCAIKNKCSPHSLMVVDGISAVGSTALEMDKWGIDVLVAGSQKAFMIPPGLSMIALSKKAWSAYTTSSLPKFYFDLGQELKSVVKNQTFFSSSVSLIRALRVSLNHWSDNGGVDEQIAHCLKLAKLSHKLTMGLGLELFSQSPAPSVTAIVVPESIDGVQLRLLLEEQYNVTVMGGQGQLKGKILRIGHLGYINEAQISETYFRIGLALMDLGYERNSIEHLKAVCKVKD
ncbi:MAG: alanine--glyoxylate aminotransferase family protein [Bdellovibrionaceae bacterium]|nr:alanine--glyoxylate aminotransferase family protein [Pseudobdellovibrionaceae bacterium]